MVLLIRFSYEPVERSVSTINTDYLFIALKKTFKKPLLSSRWLRTIRSRFWSFSLIIPDLSLLKIRKIAYKLFTCVTNENMQRAKSIWHSNNLRKRMFNHDNLMINIKCTLHTTHAKWWQTGCKIQTVHTWQYSEWATCNFD